LSLNKAIGGYFELELSPAQDEYLYHDAKKYVSARSAFYAFLLVGKPSAVWMPRYICDSMLAPLKKANIKIKFYSINLEFLPVSEIDIRSNELLFYVNYFGICDKQELKVLERFGYKNVICDHSQAFFCPPIAGVAATIYSPRKFFGLPDGGLLISDIDVSVSDTRDVTSADRVSHLLGRLALRPEDFYEKYLISEASLNKIVLDQISLLTECLLSRVDYQNVRNRRLENFRCYEQITRQNDIELDCSGVPVAYPLLCSNGLQVRKKLIADRVFTPIYWADVIERDGITEDEKRLARDLVALPLDQRYERPDIERVIDLVNEE
jgi:hypothetical protein